MSSSEGEYLYDTQDTKTVDLVGNIATDLVRVFDSYDLSGLLHFDVHNWLVWRESATEIAAVIAQSIIRIDAIKDATDYQRNLGDIAFVRKQFKSSIEDTCSDLAGWYEDVCSDLKKKSRAKMNRYRANSKKQKL